MNDLISRQAAIDLIESIETERLKGNIELIYAPAIKGLRALPSAQPKRGKWIYHIDDLFPAESTKECDQCHAEQLLICDDEFCPRCGAKMEVTE